MTKPNNPSDNYPNMHAVNSALAENENLSEHNKKVLENFFDKWRSRVDRPDGYAIRFNQLASHIDFKLDEPERSELEEIYKKLDRDEITQSNGEVYAANTKLKFHKALSTFYNNFIDYPNRGYQNKEFNGPSAINGDKELLDTSRKSEVKKETKPSPKQVKNIAEGVDSLRNRCILIFG